MKITRKQIRKIIKEALLLEEPADYYRDYRAGNITRAEYEQLVKDFENRNKSRGGYGTPSNPIKFDRPKSQAMIDLETEPIWKGSKNFPCNFSISTHGWRIYIVIYNVYIWLTNNSLNSTI